MTHLLKRCSVMLRAMGFAVVILAASHSEAQEPKTTLRFEVSFPESLRPQPITGRVFAIISRSNEREPRFQVGRTGTPFFGRDIEQLAPDQAAVIDESELGSPVPSLRQIPAGDYYVQGFINVYTEFHRADGHVVWMHDDQWEGQHWQRSPGNLYSLVQRVYLDPGQGGTVRLVADQVVPPIEIPPDTKWVKRFRFQSPMLSKFWGRPIYLGATVLLPRDYDKEKTRYPVIYVQGHFSLSAPVRFEEGGNLYNEWIKDDFPKMIVVTFQHPNPYFDDSYAVNSENVGPYGDAILQELIPEVERRYRVIQRPYARLLTGGSTGGWETLALQIFHPDFFGGAFAYAPDPVTFSNVEGINIYGDRNAFHKQHEWYTVFTANSRNTDGNLRMTSKQRNHFELVCGTRGRSGEQLDIWSAVYGPMGEDGTFKPLFNKLTGEMDPTVADYWKENYDLLFYLKRNWATIGPKLVGKLHVYVGTMDNYYLNVAVQELEKWMKTTANPHYEGYFEYGAGGGHGWGRRGAGAAARRLRMMASYILDHIPQNATATWWTSAGPRPKSDN